MGVYTYVDYSNLHVLGKRIASYKAGLLRSFTEEDRNVTLRPWSCAFEELYIPSKRALLVTSDPFSGYVHAKRAGFEVVSLPKNYYGKEKGVDTFLSVEMVKDTYEKIDPEVDNVILMAGDADHTPAVKFMVSRGIDVTVMFWYFSDLKSKISLAEAATRSVSMLPYWDSLTYIAPTTIYHPNTAVIR